MAHGKSDETKFDLQELPGGVLAPGALTHKHQERAKCEYEVGKRDDVGTHIGKPVNRFWATTPQRFAISDANDDPPIYNFSQTFTAMSAFTQSV
jgi:hypothetical protein